MGFGGGGWWELGRIWKELGGNVEYAVSQKKNDRRDQVLEWVDMEELVICEIDDPVDDWNQKG